MASPAGPAGPPRGRHPWLDRLGPPAGAAPAGSEAQRPEKAEAEAEAAAPPGPPARLAASKAQLAALYAQRLLSHEEFRRANRRANERADAQLTRACGLGPRGLGRRALRLLGGLAGFAAEAALLALAALYVHHESALHATFQAQFAAVRGWALRWGPAAGGGALECEAPLGPFVPLDL